MADPIRAAYERVFTGSNRTAATWAAFRAGWHAATSGVRVPVAYADRIAFESAMNAGKGCDVWPEAGGYTERTGRELIALYADPAGAPASDDVQAWQHEEDPARVISAVQKAQALRGGGASASSVKPYRVPLTRGVALPELTEREQTLAGLLKRCARCLPPEHATRKLATDYLKQQGFINPLRGNAGVTAVEALLIPREGAGVRFCTRQSLSQDLGFHGVTGVFRDGRFWSADMADHWTPGEVTRWEYVPGAQGAACHG